MTNQGVNFQLPSGGQFSVAVDSRAAATSQVVNNDMVRPKSMRSSTTFRSRAARVSRQMGVRLAAA